MRVHVAVVILLTWDDGLITLWFLRQFWSNSDRLLHFDGACECQFLATPEVNFCQLQWEIKQQCEFKIKKKFTKLNGNEHHQVSPTEAKFDVEMHFP